MSTTVDGIRQLGSSGSGDGLGDILAVLNNSIVTVNGATTAATGSMHLITDIGTPADYTVTLPTAVGNTGKHIGFKGDSVANLTKFVTIDAAGSELIGVELYEFIIAGRTFVVESDGTQWIIVAQNEYRLPGNLTYDAITTSLTTTQINTVLRQMPRNLNTYTLSIEFGAGTYTLTEKIEVHGYTNGALEIIGDATISALSVAQDRILDASALADDAVLFNSCLSLTTQKGFKVLSNSNAAYSGTVVTSSPGFLSLYNYFLGNGTTAGSIGINFSLAGGQLVANNVSNMEIGVQSSTSMLLSSGGGSVATIPLYGMNAVNGGVIGKSGAQPTGSTANELTSAGGVIR